MTLRLSAVAFDTPNPEAAGTFWAGVLGRRIRETHDGVLVPGSETQLGLRFVAASAFDPATAPLRQRLHLHVATTSSYTQTQVMETAVRLGGSRRGTQPIPADSEIYMSDPAGYDFCIIEPGNSYLAGCGPLGEVTCDGTRHAGLFWRDALGWPLVWDEGSQTAVQSPLGGTKIAWDGAEDGTEYVPDEQRFELVADDLAAELRRLAGLGATILDEDRDVVTLADPDGGVLTVREDRRPSV
nr:VOC family protein [Propionicimonas sp.]